MSIRSHFLHTYIRSGNDENRGLMPQAKEVEIVDGIDISNSPSVSSSTSDVSESGTVARVYESQSFIRGFFSNHSEFAYDEKKDLFEQFHALADYMSWDTRHTETAHAHLQDALVLQFNAMYGADEKSLAHWQLICQMLHVFLVPTDIAACKEEIRRLNFNLCDLVAAGWVGAPVPRFRDEWALFLYTLDTGKYFPAQSGYAGGLLRALLPLVNKPIPAGLKRQAGEEDGIVPATPGKPSAAPYITAYFARHAAGFDPRKATMPQFTSLRKALKWNDNMYAAEWAALQLALVQHFNMAYGKDAQKLGPWRALCRTLGIQRIPDTVPGCLEMLDHTYFNIIDLIDCSRWRKPVPVFPDAAALKKYSAQSNKVFSAPVKEGTILARLLNRRD